MERVLDGVARADDLEETVSAWAGGPRRRPLHVELGMTADDLDLIASTPDALRYLLHARRFNIDVAPNQLAGQARVRAYAARLAADVVDPHELAALDAWLPHVDAVARVQRPEQAVGAGA